MLLCSYSNGNVLKVLFLCKIFKFHHRSLRDLIDQWDMRMWVGLNDRGMEGQFRLNDGTKYDPNYNENNLYEWKNGEPNNLYDEDCVSISDKKLGQRHLLDEDCNTAFHGLCAIRTYKC